MNKIILIGGLSLALVFGAIVTAHAFGKDDGKGAYGMKTGMTKFDPAKFEQARLDKMKKDLGLSDDQVEKLKALFKSHREELKPLQEKMKTDVDTLRTKKEAKATDSELKPVLDLLSADRKNMQDLRQKQQEQIRGILTPDQQAKMVLNRPFKGKGGLGDRRQHREGKVEKNTTK
jgi:Spy/CpxP family protein refolding chaperone